MRVTKKKNNYNNVYKIRKRTPEQLEAHKDIHKYHALRFVQDNYPPRRLKRMATYAVLIKRAFEFNGNTWTVDIETE